MGEVSLNVKTEAFGRALTKSSVKQEQNNYDLAPAERRPKHSKSNKMKIQKNMKYCGKNPQDRLNEEEIGNLPEKEFRVIIVKII